MREIRAEIRYMYNFDVKSMILYWCKKINCIFVEKLIDASGIYRLPLP